MILIRKHNHQKAGFPVRFTNSVVKQFEEKVSSDVDLLIPEFILFVDFKLDFAMKWSTKKVNQLFRLKDKNPHPAFKIYEASIHVVKITLARQSEMYKRGGMSTKTYEKTLNLQNI